MEFLVKLDEVRRLFTLTGDMSCEILSRTLPPDLGFQAEDEAAPPGPGQCDALLRVCHALLPVHAGGARCQPGPRPRDAPRGHGELRVPISSSPSSPGWWTMSSSRSPGRGSSKGTTSTGDRRCHLSEGLIERLLARLYSSVKSEEIDDMVARFRDSLLDNRPFSISPGEAASQ